MDKEIWKDIKGYEGLYQVSNYGRVKSLGREVKYKNGRVSWYNSMILKPMDNGRGYLTVHLRKNGKRSVKYIHRLVAETFINDIENNDINHKDFDRKNNRLDNLEICSRKENINYSYKNGRFKNSFVKRSQQTIKNKDEQIKKHIEDITKRIDNNEPAYKVARDYGFDIRTLQRHGFIK